jgi:hypothetical protein
MYIWRALLRVSAQQHPQSGHVALTAPSSSVNRPHNTISNVVAGA